MKVRDLVEFDGKAKVVTNSELREDVSNNAIISRGTDKQYILLRI